MSVSHVALRMETVVICRVRTRYSFFLLSCYFLFAAHTNFLFLLLFSSSLLLFFSSSLLFVFVSSLLLFFLLLTLVLPRLSFSFSFPLHFLSTPSPFTLPQVPSSSFHSLFSVPSSSLSLSLVAKCARPEDPRHPTQRSNEQC